MIQEKKLKEQLGQLFFVGLKGKTLSRGERKFLIKYNIGGILLFKKNIESPEQLYQLCFELHNLSSLLPSKAPFFIGIDMEGGRVQRLKSPFTIWPALKWIGEMKNDQIAFKASYFMGREIKAVGFNLNFSPCLDVLTNPNPKDRVIGDRSLGSDPYQVARLGSMLIHGHQEAGILCCAKHFPGHGDTEVDSHVVLPVEETSLEDLNQKSLIPFIENIKSSLNLEMLMTAHIQFSKIDPLFPVTLSSFFLKDLLRKKLKYKGIVVSDHLEMKAISRNFKPSFAPVQALNAGCDLLIYRRKRKVLTAYRAVLKAISSKKEILNKKNLLESLNRIESLKKRHLKNEAPPLFKESLKIIGCKEHRDLADLIAKKQEKSLNQANPQDLS